jgi:hypothetical protein
MFWLNGMAGTGKSTISRTVAQTLADEGCLAASFFFKRGEGERGKASRFFTTITAQLILRIPALASHVKRAIDVEPAISWKAMREQFEKLILQPLSGIHSGSEKALTHVIVVDALDECDGEGHIRTIIQLLSRLKSVNVRVFVTSRPELPIRLGFSDVSGGTYQDLVLHQLPESIIEHDLTVFLNHELAKIRHEHNKLFPQDCSLPSSWPSRANVQKLVKMSIPLFIFAATVCRFVGERNRDPEEQLAAVLRYETASQASNLDKTYLPVLNQLYTSEYCDEEKDSLIRNFGEIVGTIIILVEPLSTISLSGLLHVPKKMILRMLNSLQAVLNLPEDRDSPVRLLHLSFRDFLLHEETVRKTPFWIDERERNEVLTTKCLDLMSSPKGLCRNMCDLEAPGKLRTD